MPKSVFVALGKNICGRGHRDGWGLPLDFTRAVPKMTGIGRTRVGPLGAEMFCHVEPREPSINSHREGTEEKRKWRNMA